MTQTRESRRSVFRQIVKQSYVDWPAYESTPLFDRRTLPALESDICVVAEAWFNQDEHEGIEPFVHALPLAYVRFDVVGNAVPIVLNFHRTDFHIADSDTYRSHNAFSTNPSGACRTARHRVDGAIGVRSAPRAGRTHRRLR